jgi:hypothetical protein
MDLATEDLQKSSDAIDKMRKSLHSQSVEESNDPPIIDVVSMPLMDTVHMNNTTPVLSKILGHDKPMGMFDRFNGLLIPAIPEQNVVDKRRRTRFDQSFFNSAEQYRRGEDYRRMPPVPACGNW